ncbi:threonine/serine exporter family protein [Methanobacterium paludis]|uniref:Threonine/serine exporter-like N-terminal domain-containing protein n=1 Tax=Methanobacterium paludis (strain DSM 25820 / JCM 18151 / SWAN1) TaxID=868131 RepID=F6D5V0_METPW|nr:threonine/serine exporter family protein [Methanobacterium paludis]AEG18903.1 protein of unknown function DUF1212 [Methanobacterium paludis]
MQTPDKITQKTGSQTSLLEFLMALGKALISAGISVVDITSILERIACAYKVKAEVLIFPTVLLVKLGETESAPLSASNQKPGLIPLNQVSEIYKLIYQAENAEISPEDGKKRLKQILTEKHRFGSIGTIIGYTLFSIGIGMLMRFSPEQILVSGAFGVIVAFLILFGENQTKVSLLLPVIAALIVSSLFFLGMKEGFLTGTFIMLIPALAYFLPGAILTTGMFELASGEIISGASRVISGAAILLLLLFGLIVGLEIAGLPLQQLMFISPSNTSIWWIPYIGVLVFGVGMYLFMSIERRDMPWIILILYIAFMGEQVGNHFVGGFFGGFLGSLLMAVSGTLTERYDHGTPGFISILPAFWILVPGSLGFISLASLVGQNYPAAINNALLVTMTIVAISLGLLVGRVLTEPLKVEK